MVYKTCNGVIFPLEYLKITDFRGGIKQVIVDTRYILYFVSILVILEYNRGKETSKIADSDSWSKAEQDRAQTAGSGFNLNPS
jgi:hypothetical protein